MYFYVDESGHTGLNLFDANQPVLYYGLISSSANLDEVAVNAVRAVREKLGVARLHSNELGVARLSSVAEDIAAITAEFGLTFDLLRVMKPDHALISFFDQTFDQGLNPAVPWMWYWSPLKYVLLLSLPPLFDDELLKRAWEVRINTRDEVANPQYVSLCEELIRRVEQSVSDKRLREILLDSLRWAAANPGEIHYNAYDRDDTLQISPNLVGFQSVMHTIARRLGESNVEASRVVVDRQTQFNRAQEWLAGIYAQGKGNVFPGGVGVPELDLRNMPAIPISPTAGDESVGLEIVDIYLWIFKRFYERKDLSPELIALIGGQAECGTTDEVSLQGIHKRWIPFLMNLPEPTAEQMAKVQEIKDIQEGRREGHVIRNGQSED
jgi:hypothetical protein